MQLYYRTAIKLLCKDSFFYVFLLLPSSTIFYQMVLFRAVVSQKIGCLNYWFLTLCDLRQYHYCSGFPVDIIFRPINYLLLWGNGKVTSTINQQNTFELFKYYLFPIISYYYLLLDIMLYCIIANWKDFLDQCEIEGILPWVIIPWWWFLFVKFTMTFKS